MAPARDRKAQLITVSATYFEALARKNFDAVPWTKAVVFRGPLAPGGAETPLIGREAVLAFFNAIGPNLGEVRIVGHFFNEDLTAIMTKAEVGVVQPPCVLRVADLFEVDAEGRITSQENHYDPRPAMATPSTDTRPS